MGQIGHQVICAMREALTFTTQNDLDDTRLVVELVTSTSLAPHESVYRGGDYFLGQSDLDGEIIVQRNEELDEPAVDHDAPTVVYIGPTLRADELIDAFESKHVRLVQRRS